MSHLSALTDPTAALTGPMMAAGRMANLDLLMDRREDAYEAMRRLVPGLAWSLAERAEMTALQLAATERFEELNRQVRSFRSV